MENKANLFVEGDNKMHELSSPTVSYSPSFSYYASARENQSYDLADHHSVNVEDADFEFETSPLHEDSFVHFPPFKNVKKDDDFETAAENISGNCLWRSPLRSPAVSKRSELSKRCRLKKFLTRSHSDSVVLAPSASKRCYFKEFMRRSHSHGGDASKTTSPAVKGMDKKASSKVGEGDKRRKSYLPYRQDLIGVFAGIRGLRR